MTEERTIGGTCVNRGCLPSKNLIEAAKIIHDARNPRYPGLTPTQIGLDFRKLIEQKDDVIHGYRKKKYESLTGGQFTIEKGHVEFVDDHSVQVDGKRITGETLLIATGSRPVVPNIEGLCDVPYLTSDLLTNDEPMELWELPRSLIILGGGYIALELGQMFHRFGAEVVIGHEIGSQMATPVGSQDGGIAAHNAFVDGEPRRVNHRVIPRTIFTDPQVATVGVTEEEAIAAGHDCWCNTVPMSLVPRAGTIRDTHGLIKMIADRDTEEVLGVSMVGNSAGQVIHEAAMAIRFQARINDFVELLHVYPTMAEALKIVAISRRKDPAKLFCFAE